MNEPKDPEAAEPVQTDDIKSVDLPRLVRRFEQNIEAFDEDIKIHWLYMHGGPLPGWHTNDDPPWTKEDSRHAINDLLELRKDYMMMRDDPMGVLPIQEALDYLRECREPNTDPFEARRNHEVGEFLRFSKTCDEVVRKWDFDGVEGYRALLDKKPESSFQGVETTFLNLIACDTELWDNDLFPPRNMFLCALMLVRWAVYKTCTEEEAAEYRDWSDALRYMAQWVRGEEDVDSFPNTQSTAAE
jgi:hypothetical protein